MNKKQKNKISPYPLIYIRLGIRYTDNLISEHELGDSQELLSNAMLAREILLSASEQLKKISLPLPVDV